MKMQVLLPTQGAEVKAVGGMPAAKLTKEDRLKEIKRIAVERGGECLSDEYVNKATKLRFRCGRDGFEWDASPHNIKKDTWCPKCNSRPHPNRLREVIEIAKSKGGKCLSTEYNIHKSKLLFRCEDGHEWNATHSAIKNSGSWCPSCVNKTEALVRQFLECVLGVDLPNKSPGWVDLLGKKLRYMLDGYNEKEKLAFEYHGVQHFKHNDHFHREGGKSLLDQQKKDQFIRDKCTSEGIILIEVNTLPINFTIDELIKSSIDAVVIATGKAVDKNLIEKFRGLPHGLANLAALHKIAKSKGGECLATKYLGCSSLLLFRCKRNHEWSATPSSIKQGRWCAVCAGKKIINPLDEIQKIATERGGKCLSTEYKCCGSKLLFRCRDGHEWDAAPTHLKKGSWCAICAGLKLINPLGEMREIAKSRGGECLSTEYVNSRSKLHFMCEKGHEWDAASGLVKRGGWCAVCSGNRIIDPLGEIQGVAKLKGGECLSGEYVSNKVKLRFKCSGGHEWESTPKNIKKGRWCPTCAKQNRRKPPIKVDSSPSEQ